VRIIARLIAGVIFLALALTLSLGWYLQTWKPHDFETESYPYRGWARCSSDCIITDDIEDPPYLETDQELSTDNHYSDLEYLP